jgi:RNA polymerase sigma-70 factor (family 1)
MKQTSNKFQFVIPPQQIHTEPDLLKRLSVGDHDALAWLYKNFSARIYDYSFLLTSNPQLSEDLVQDVFFKIWQKRHTIPEVQNFNAWLYTITRNLVISYFRRHTFEKRYAEEILITATISANNCEQAIQENEYKRRIAQAESILSPRELLVYQLRRQHNWPRHKIARHLNTSPCTVKSQIQKALKKLKTQLRDLNNDRSV